MGEPILYLIMRNDLPSLNPGKLAAQAAHCANAFVASKRWRNTPMLKRWQKQTEFSYGTTIVLGAPLCFFTDDDTEVAMDNLVYDPSYPCEVPREVADFFVMEEGHAVPHGKYKWSFTVTNGGRGILLRPELVGAFEFGEEQPEYLKALSLYP